MLIGSKVVAQTHTDNTKTLLYPYTREVSKEHPVKLICKQPLPLCDLDPLSLILKLAQILSRYTIVRKLKSSTSKVIARRDRQADRQKTHTHTHTHTHCAFSNVPIPFLSILPTQIQLFCPPPSKLKLSMVMTVALLHHMHLHNHKIK